MGTILTSVTWYAQALAVAAYAVRAAPVLALFALRAVFSFESRSAVALSVKAFAFSTAAAILTWAFDRLGAVFTNETWVAEALAQHADTVPTAAIWALGVVERNFKA